MKNKTATLTWLHNGNYGTILQAYSLQRVLELNDYENVIINYKPSKLTKVINLFACGNSMKLFYYKFLGFLNTRAENKLKQSTGNNEYTSKNEAFEVFIKDKLKTTEAFHTPRELRKLRNKYDTYICGSDQIWNPVLLNPPYFFSFLSDLDKMIAYAPSFGVTSIEKKKKKRIKRYLAKFSALSAREEQGLGMFKALGFDDDRIPVVLDPVVLLEKCEWDKFIENANSETTPYILCYFLHENPVYWKAVEKLASILGYKVIVVPVSADAFKCPYDIRQNAGPDDWVDLVGNAEFILTDSYHCVLFSLIFHVNFYVFKRFEDNDPESQNSRIHNILGKIGLEDRFLSMSAQLPPEITVIDDFENVDKIFDKERKKSLSYLKNAIDM